ncbi:hypothetical protein DRO32_03030 [Candidatus Bathyarchaeota archaeon]|nr:MAG: hypothetical protein DRO32_03030 [Candidatus Bathyarchaeota archaeon]
MNGPITETAVFEKEVKVTFDAAGASSSSDIILTVDGVDYAASSLPLTFWWKVDSSHTFEWHTPVNVKTKSESPWNGAEVKREVWSSTSGLSTARSGTITVPDSDGNHVTATYKKQYRLKVWDNGGWGDTSPLAGLYWYDEGTSVTITAYPDDGSHTITVYLRDAEGYALSGQDVTVYAFAGDGTNVEETDTTNSYGKAVLNNYPKAYFYKWKVDGTEYPLTTFDSTSYTVTMNTWHWIKAYFDRSCYHELIAPQKAEVTIGSKTYFLPFWKWTDGLTSNERIIYEITSDLTYTAKYKCVIKLVPAEGETKVTDYYTVNYWIQVLWRFWTKGYVQTHRGTPVSGATMKWRVYAWWTDNTYGWSGWYTYTTGSDGWFNMWHDVWKPPGVELMWAGGDAWGWERQITPQEEWIASYYEKIGLPWWPGF